MIIAIREFIGYVVLAIYVWMTIYNQFSVLIGSQLAGLYILFLLLAFGALVLFSNYLCLLKLVLGVRWHWLRKAIATMIILFWLARYDMNLFLGHFALTLLMMLMSLYSIWWGAFDQLGERFEIHGAERGYILSRDPPKTVSDLFPFHGVLVFFLSLPLVLPLFH